MLEGENDEHMELPDDGRLFLQALEGLFIGLSKADIPPNTLEWKWTDLKDLIKNTVTDAKVKISYISECAELIEWFFDCD